MPVNQPISERNLDGYGAPPIEWARVGAVLNQELTQAPGTGGPGRHTSWLTTINPDGSAHVTAVGVMSVDGAWYFTSGPGVRKSRNIARDDRCVVSVATEPFDLVVEGRAERVTDATELETVAGVYAAQGWPARVEGDALTAEYSAQSAGPPPWHLYRVESSTVYALGTTEPYGAARFDLAAPKLIDDEAAIRALIEHWAEAVHAGDIQRVLADHADDIVMFDVPPPDDVVLGIDAYRATWPGFFDWQREAVFEIVDLEVTAGVDVAFAHALLRCGTPEELENNPANLLRLTIGLRKQNGRWIVTHEHHSFPSP